MGMNMATYESNETSEVHEDVIQYEPFLNLVLS